MAQAYRYLKKPLWQWVAIYFVVGIILYITILTVFNKELYPSSHPGKSIYKVPQSSPTHITHTVTIANFTLSPQTQTIRVGEKITWTNQDSMQHSATADDKSFDTNILDSGKSATITFTKKGSYTYHCRVHPSMQGTIIVN